MSETLVSPLGVDLPNGWKIHSIGEMCVKIGSGATPKGGSAVYTETGVNFIRSQNVFDHRFSRTGLAHINEEAAQKLSSVTVSARDVLLNITGDGETIARCCVTPSWALPARVNQHVMILRTGNDLVPEYLQRYLSQPAMRTYMLNHNSGGSRRALTKGQVESFKIAVPSIEEQQAIATVLGALDDKIAVNEHIAATVSCLGQEKFRLLSLSGETEMSVGDVIDLKYGKSLPSTQRIAGDIPVFGSGGISGSHETALVKGPGVIVGRKGTVGSVYWSETDFFPIDTTFYVVRKNSRVSLEYMYFALRNLGLEHMNSDSVVPGLNRERAHSLTVRLPAMDAMQSFTTDVRGLFELQQSREQEIRGLATLRDTLLPQLMSGRLRVKDAEKIVEDHV